MEDKKAAEKIETRIKRWAPVVSADRRIDDKKNRNSVLDGARKVMEAGGPYT